MFLKKNNNLIGKFHFDDSEYIIDVEAIKLSKQIDNVSENFMLESKKNLIGVLEKLYELSPTAELQGIISRLVSSKSSLPPTVELENIISDFYFRASLSKEPKENGLSHDLLTFREDEIIRLLAKGMRNQQIADKLFISVHTVRTHRNNIHRKLKINNKNLNPVIYYEKYLESVA